MMWGHCKQVLALANSLKDTVIVNKQTFSQSGLQKPTSNHELNFHSEASNSKMLCQMISRGKYDSNLVGYVTQKAILTTLFSCQWYCILPLKGLF